MVEKKHQVLGVSRLDAFMVNFIKFWFEYEYDLFTQVRQNTWPYIMIGLFFRKNRIEKRLQKCYNICSRV